MTGRRSGHPRRRGLRGDEGQAMVEFVLVLPLLLVLLLGMLDFGKAFNYWIDANHLASEGARLAAVAGTNAVSPGNCVDGSAPAGQTLVTYVQCQADTKELLQGGTAQVPSKLQVCVQPLIDNDTQTIGQVGDPIRVTVKATYNWLGFLVSRVGIGSSVSIAGVATERLEHAWGDGTAAQCSS